VRGANSRRIQGTAEINGRPGTYLVDVTDSESGSDSFAIQLSNGYNASGNLKHGRIEIHNRCRNDDDRDKDHKDRDKDRDHKDRDKDHDKGHDKDHGDKDRDY
jgi:hypothetical protein